MKNKKGDIPITILVIGVVAVCVLTIFSFVFADSKQRETFAGAGLIEAMYSFEEENRLANSEEIKGFVERELFAIASGGWTTIRRKGNVIKGFYSPLNYDKDKSLISIEYTPK
jgi:hypothetical protein